MSSELVVFMINGWDSEYAHRTVLGQSFLALQRTSLVTILVPNGCDHISSSKLIQTNSLQVGVQMRNITLVYLVFAHSSLRYFHVCFVHLVFGVGLSLE